MCDDLIIRNKQRRASGPWTERQIDIIPGERLRIIAEPGDWGAVQVEVPSGPLHKRARLTLAALAYGLHDLVAKQSVKDQPWVQLKAPPGRPKTGRALSGAERQRRFRQSNRH